MILTGKTHAPARSWVRDGRARDNLANSGMANNGWEKSALRPGVMSGHWTGRLSDSVLMACVVVLAATALAAFAVAAPLILAGSALIGLIARNGAPTAWRPVRVRQRAH